MENLNTLSKIRTLNHSPINALFNKNSSDFVVREIPLYEFSGDGEHLILQIEKKDLTTNEALRILSANFGVKMRDFGYAGLKDKMALTSQFISMPRKFGANLDKFSHEKMKILSATYHKNKLRIGHLKGNRFFVCLKKVQSVDAKKLQNALNLLDINGFANYFGYQRFGKFKDNAEQGREILQGNLRLKNPKISQFLLSSYQSELFNIWLSKRVEMSKFADEFSQKELIKIYGFDGNTARNLKNQPQFYKLINGEILGHYPYGKCFVCEDLLSEVERFNRREISSMGLIFGANSLQALGLAGEIEKLCFANAQHFVNKLNGARRYAWVYLSDLKYIFDAEVAHFKMEFSLPKGSYATIVLEEILGRNLCENEINFD